MRLRSSITVCALALASIVFASPVPGGIKAALNNIGPDGLRGDLSFLSSDALQGRFTPSPGLDIAAEFIASRFREAGLVSPIGKDYFQVAEVVDRHVAPIESPMNVTAGGQTFTVPATSLSVYNVSAAAHIDNAAVVVLAARNPTALKDSTGKEIDLAGKAVVVAQPEMSTVEVYRAARSFDAAVSKANAAVEIIVNTRRPPSGNRLLFPNEASPHGTPIIWVDNGQLQSWTVHPDANAGPRTISLDIPAPNDKTVAVRNVIGVLPGSDPALKDTCVMVTAHYDHIGTTETANGMAMDHPNGGADHIYNGANDDGSGTVSVIAIAEALAHLNPRPKRSIVFMTFFGEERGEFGSRYYGEHPVFPIEKTVADINLEQVGRTDATEGKHVNWTSVTGFDYSDVTKYLETAGKAMGVSVVLEKDASDAYFTRSDNDALAQQGVPAHTLTTAFEYPDYHGLADEWQKIDYDNMARVDRMVALALVNMAESAKAPRWNADNPKTAPFRAALDKLSHSK